MQNIFKFICCGNVDDGKSTLIGRLLVDTNNVKRDQLDDALKASKKNGSEKMEFAMLLDGLLAEREQQITIDIAHRFFDYKDIRFHILDCPGHEQYTKNMAIAAAEVNTAIVVIDSTKGIKPQTLKHIEICNLFNVKNLLIALTKTDLLPQNFETKNSNPILQKLEEEIITHLASYQFNYEIIPVSAITDFNMDYVLKFLYKNALNHIEEQEKNTKNILHIYASKLFNNKRFYYAKSILKNTFSKNEKLTVYPQNTQITISDWHDNGAFNIAENVDISKGDCITNYSVIISNQIQHKSFFFSKKTDNMLFKHGTNIRRVVSLSPTYLELDECICFNNIDDVKTNGFGIYIDEITKKTLGCAVFKSNKTDEKNKIEAQNYIIYGSTHLKRIEKAIEFKNQFHPIPIILDESDLQNTIITDNENATQKLLNLAEYLNQQGFSSICLLEKRPKTTSKTHTYISID